MNLVKLFTACMFFCFFLCVDSTELTLVDVATKIRNAIIAKDRK